MSSMGPATETSRNETRGAKVNRDAGVCAAVRASRWNTRATGAAEPARASLVDSAACRATIVAAKRADRVEVVTPHPSLPTAVPSLIIHPSIDRRDLSDPFAALGMFHGHDLPLRPVEVIGDKGYLLVQVVEGVA